MIRLIIFILLIGVGLLTSCDKPKDQKKVRLSYNERRKVDTIYRAKIKLLAPAFDSLCKLRKEQELQNAIDSILQVRKREEIKLLQRSIGQEKKAEK